MPDARRNSKISFAPLLEALQQLETGLAREGAARIIVGAPTLEEFERQKLPPHCKVTQRKLLGPRVPVRGQRQVARFSSAVAHWPRDGLVEGISASLFFVTSGEADIRIGDYVVTCRIGEMFFIPAGIPKLDGSRPHYEDVTPEAHCDLLMLHQGDLRPDCISAGLCQSRGETHEHPSEGGSCWIKSNLLTQLFIGLGEELQGGDEAGSTPALLTALILLLHQELKRGHAFKSWEFPSGSSHLQSRSPIPQAQEYMQNHLNRPLTTEQVARWVGLSRTAFTTQFRDETKSSFKQHLTALRLEHAQELLGQSNLSIQRVSERVGLTSGQLRNLFQQTHHCTPGEFRHSQKNVQD